MLTLKTGLFLLRHFVIIKEVLTAVLHLGSNVVVKRHGLRFRNQRQCIEAALRRSVTRRVGILFGMIDEVNNACRIGDPEPIKRVR